MDTATLCAALLHDTLEDTALTRSKIDRVFGREVGKLVEGVTKLGKIDFKSTEEEAAEIAWDEMGEWDWRETYWDPDYEFDIDLVPPKPNGKYAKAHSETKS